MVLGLAPASQSRWSSLQNLRLELALPCACPHTAASHMLVGDGGVEPDQGTLPYITAGCAAQAGELVGELVDTALPVTGEGV